MNLKEKLEYRSIPEPNTGCILWTGCSDKDGYGIIGIKKNYFRAHRVSYSLSYGEIPNGLFVCHKCDTPSCINPNHLYLGTNSDNQKDVVKRKRSKRWLFNIQTHCIRGHEFTVENTVERKLKKSGGRNITCRICHRLRDSKYRKRLRGIR